MGRILGGKLPLVLVVGYFTTTLATASANEDSTLKIFQELNAVTGTEPMQGILKTLLDDKALAKKIVDTALPLAKEKKGKLSYNAALVLALLTAEAKDMAKSELFFRVCMEKAAKLQSQSKILQAYGGLIDLYYDNKKYDDSARICQELLELKTDDGKPRIVLTAYKTQFGEIDFKEDDSFDSAKRIRPGVHRLLVQAIAKQGKYDQALKLTDNLIKAKDHWMERQLRAWVLHEAGKFDEAVKAYKDVMQRVAKDKDLDPEDKEAYLERYRYVLSNILLEKGDIKGATEQLEELLAKSPDNPGYNNDLGYILADNGLELDKAEQMIRKALELDKKRRQTGAAEEDRENGAYLDSLGWVLFKKKDYKEAKKYLLVAVKDKASRHIEIYDHLGDVYMALGEKAEAVAAWRKGLEFVGEGRRDQERKAIVEKKIEQNK